MKENNIKVIFDRKVGKIRFYSGTRIVKEVDWKGEINIEKLLENHKKNIVFFQLEMTPEEFKKVNK